MTLDRLAEDIAAAAEEEAKAILDEAEAEAKSLIADAKGSAETTREENSTRAAKEADQIAKETVASARQANQKDVLIARREELDATKSMLLEEISSPSLNGRATIIQRLLDDARSAGDKGMILRPVGIDRAAIEAAGSGWNIGDDTAGLGGFVLESEDGSISLDFRFDSLLEGAWDSQRNQVNEILFG